MKKVNIGIIGLGTVGRGVVDSMISNGSLIAERAGVSLEIKGVCETNRDILDGINPGLCGKRTTDAYEIINDKDIDIVVELIGGIHPAKEIILKAIEARKHVVTANKALLSEHWKDIFEAASRNNVFVKFEASVGGAIPVIRSLRQSFVANRIDTIYGILNGTTNFILSEMSQNGSTFAKALAAAQKKGFAESNPELDVSGKDSAQKLAILSLLCFGKGVSPEHIYTEGITKIGPEDLKNASMWGYSVKLLAIAKDLPEGIELRVHPTLLPVDHILSDVDGANNAVFMRGDLMGESLLFGKGAGQKPTSSAVLGDIVDIARHMSLAKTDCAIENKMDYRADGPGIKSMEDLEVSYYFRFTVTDKPGVLAGISSILADSDISIASVSQEERNVGRNVPVVILTHKAKEGDMRRAIGRINEQGYVKAETVVIRMEE
jgi:homoserine dehydrogenase